MTDEVSTVACWVERVYMRHGDWVADRRGQHGGVLDRMCQYAPIQKYKLLRNRLAMCELLGYEMILKLRYEQY